jgi:chloride channel protein, CIC family
MQSDMREKYIRLGFFSFSLLAVLMGIVGGFAAVLFRWLIALFHNLLFLGQLSIHYNANFHTPANPLGMLVILVPVAGAAGVVFLVKNFAPEAKGHGVPEVMDAIYYEKGKIRPVVAMVKSLASALSIGSGGSVGREGPIIQIGASFGSTVAQVLKLPTWQRVTLIAAGAGAGIAATFNTPVGAVLFAVEILLHEVSVRTLVPVAIATATATYMGQSFLGASPSFVIPMLQIWHIQLTTPWVLLCYAGLGLLMGLVSAVYIKSIYLFEDIFERHVKGGYYVRHLTGMCLVGILMYVLWDRLGHYYIQGVGYATVQDVLDGKMNSLALLLLLFFLKLLSTSLTLGSGASGGVFSPALFMGATLGGAYGILVSRLFPSIGVNPAAFAVAGMAGLMGGSTGAALAAIVLIFEMTLDNMVLLPMTITVALSYGVRKMLSTRSIYTLKLARRGHFMPSHFMSNFHFIQKAQDIMAKDFMVLPAETNLEYFADSLLTGRASLPAVVADAAGKVVGVFGERAALKSISNRNGNTRVDELMNKNYLTVRSDTKLFNIVEMLCSRRASLALVLNPVEGAMARNVVGIIDKDHIVDAIEKPFDLLSEIEERP